jgi:hypothetical protein
MQAFYKKSKTCLGSLFPTFFKGVAYLYTLPYRFIMLMDRVIIKTYKYMLFAVWIMTSIIFYWVALDSANPITSLKCSNFSFFTPPDSTIPNGLQYSKTMCFNKGVALTAYPRYSDNSLIYMPTIHLQTPKGCNTILVDITIPKVLLKDTYTFTVEYRMQVNPLNIITESYDLYKINVIDPDKGIYTIANLTK